MQRPQQRVLKQSLRRRPLWNAYTYYESRAVKYGFARISLSNYNKDYYQKVRFL